ncbi:MAG: hypothetical protein ABI557_19555 [Aureliella sp.]
MTDDPGQASDWLIQAQQEYASYQPKSAGAHMIFTIILLEAERTILGSEPSQPIANLPAASL